MTRSQIGIQIGQEHETCCQLPSRGCDSSLGGDLGDATGSLGMDKLDTYRCRDRCMRTVAVALSSYRLVSLNPLILSSNTRINITPRLGRSLFTIYLQQYFEATHLGPLNRP